MFVQGTLSLHGAPKIATWLRLVVDAPKGADAIVVDASSGTTVDGIPDVDSMKTMFKGERVVVTGSGRHWYHHEVLNVTDVQKFPTATRMVDFAYQLRRRCCDFIAAREKTAQFARAYLEQKWVC